MAAEQLWSQEEGDERNRGGNFHSSRATSLCDVENALLGGMALFLKFTVSVVFLVYLVDSNAHDRIPFQSNFQCNDVGILHKSDRKRSGG